MKDKAEIDEVQRSSRGKLGFILERLTQTEQENRILDGDVQNCYWYSNKLINLSFY